MAEVKEVAYDALREIYEEAEPGLDFDDVLDNPDEYEDEWYDNHVLPLERQSEILDKHIEKHNLTNLEETHITFTVMLDLGPLGQEAQDA